MIDYFHLKNDAKISVVNIQGPETREQVAAATAELVHSIIMELAGKKDRIGLGLGPGTTSMMVTRALAQLLRSEPHAPNLSLHALTSGFPETEVQTSPMTFFRFFDDVPTEVEYIGLLAPPVIEASQSRAIRKQPGVREAFDRSKDIDIVLLTPASASDIYGMLFRFLTKYSPRSLEWLKKCGWQGELLFLPYSQERPIHVARGVQVATLFDWHELLEFRRRENKFSVLAVPPRPQSGSTRAQALWPLLNSPDLRVWSHLVTDISTSLEVLETAEV